jgi:hypothetical protein
MGTTYHCECWGSQHTLPSPAECSSDEEYEAEVKKFEAWQAVPCPRCETV